MFTVKTADKKLLSLSSNIYLANSKKIKFYYLDSDKTAMYKPSSNEYAIVCLTSFYIGY